MKNNYQIISQFAYAMSAELLWHVQICEINQLNSHYSRVVSKQWAVEENLFEIFSISGNILPHRGLVTPYDDRDLGQYWLR